MSLWFNPPASSASGTRNPSDPEDQFPFDMNDLNWSPSPYAIGSDWAVCRVGRNSNTGKLPTEANGGVFYKLGSFLFLFLGLFTEN